jgi:hypothetical protein
MARRRRIVRRQVDAVLELLDRIENELPSGAFITISDGEDEETIDLEEDRGVEVDDVELVIDMAVLEFQNSGVLRKRKKGTYSLSGVFEAVFGEECPVVELAVELETTLSGYQDMIWGDEVEAALSLMEEIRDWIKEETKDAVLAK